MYLKMIIAVGIVHFYFIKKDSRYLIHDLDRVFLTDPSDALDIDNQVIVALTTNVNAFKKNK